MRASIQTLTHISFNGYISLLESSRYYDFLELRFPLLTSLELGSLFSTSSPEHSNTAITRFIIAHPTIRHLSLGKLTTISHQADENNDPISFQFDENFLRADALPNLRSFEGFPKNITVLVLQKVQSLLELTKLSLSSNRKDRSLVRMFEAVKTGLVDGGPGDGCFPHVRDLAVEFHPDLSHNMETNLSDLAYRKCLDGFSEICPAVINWYGTMGPMNAVSSLHYS